MFFLITGASGVGKATVRGMIQSQFADLMETGELAEPGRPPEWSLRGRHEAVEQAVQRALRLQQEGKHFLLCGDVVPPGEVCAAPSADGLNGIAACLLHASPAAQRERLAHRGDDPALIPDHATFADWMRRHIVDCGHHPEVITNGGWDSMRWERWVGAHKPPWRCHIIDTSDLTPVEVATLAAAWIRRTMDA